MFRLLLCAAILSFLASQASATSCPVAPVHTPSPAEQAYLKAQFEQAATLYRADLEKQPQNPELIAALSRVLLRQQKVKEAEALLEPAVQQNEKSAVLLAAEGFLQFRQGTPWLAADTAGRAMALDPCLPQLHLLNARLLQLSSAYASEEREIVIAHALDPRDPSIRAGWLRYLPPAQRIPEIEDYISGENSNDASDLRYWHSYLDSLRRHLAEPHKPCRLVSNVAATDIDFIRLADGLNVRGYGLDVKLNDRNAHLEINTGTGGLVISRAMAERAGLKRFLPLGAPATGSESAVTSYSAYADSIRIGALEFHDCPVQVLDPLRVPDADGLIGMDVFSHFLVTVDYPIHRLTLAPLPKRPDEAAAAAMVLETDRTETEGTESAGAAAQVQPTVSAVNGRHDRYIAPEMKDWTRVYRVGYQMVLPVALNDAPLPRLFVLESGAFSTTIAPEVAREVTKVHEGNGASVRELNGKVDKLYTADHVLFKFGGIAQDTHDIYALDSSEMSKRDGMDIAGFIGVTTLARVTMTIDYRDALIKFAYDPKRGSR